MGVLIKLYDGILFFFFLAISLILPLIEAQACLPSDLYPTFLIDLRSWYADEFGDYLFMNKPQFYIGLSWVGLCFQWPFALASLYAIAGGNPWLTTTSLIYGASAFTSMVTILSEMTSTGKASDNLLAVYLPYLGGTILAFLRGLLPESAAKAHGMGRRPAFNKIKKRA